jgi:hypothetical protein
MRIPLILTALATLAAGCTEFTGADRFTLPPVTVSGTTYEVFQLVRSTDPNFDDVRQDPNATVAVYVTVGRGSVIYCGETAAACADLVRRFNEGDLTVREGM